MRSQGPPQLDGLLGEGLVAAVQLSHHVRDLLLIAFGDLEVAEVGVRVVQEGVPSMSWVLNGSHFLALQELARMISCSRRLSWTTALACWWTVQVGEVLPEGTEVTPLMAI